MEQQALRVGLPGGGDSGGMADRLLQILAERFNATGYQNNKKEQTVFLVLINGP
jgi:hypothetical protein